MLQLDSTTHTRELAFVLQDLINALVLLYQLYSSFRANP